MELESSYNIMSFVSKSAYVNPESIEIDASKQVLRLLFPTLRTHILPCIHFKREKLDQKSVVSRQPLESCKMTILYFSPWKETARRPRAIKFCVELSASVFFVLPN